MMLEIWTIQEAVTDVINKSIHLQKLKSKLIKIILNSNQTNTQHKHTVNKLREQIFWWPEIEIG